MIDLQVAIRSRILTDVTITSIIADYSGSQAIFTRLPTPQDTEYPLIVISPLVADNENDFVSCGRRTLTYDVFVYGLNDTSTNYRNVETVARKIQSLFHRVPSYELNMPAGSSLIEVTTLGPLVAPVDDENKVGRIIIINFDVHLEN